MKAQRTSRCLLILISSAEQEVACLTLLVLEDASGVLLGLNFVTCLADVFCILLLCKCNLFFASS